VELRWHPEEQWVQSDQYNLVRGAYVTAQLISINTSTLEAVAGTLSSFLHSLLEAYRRIIPLVIHQDHLHWMMGQIVSQHNSQLASLQESLQNQIPPLPTDPAELEAQIKQWAGEVVDERLAEEQTFRERVWQVCHEYFTWVFAPDTPIDAPGRAWVEWWWQSK